MLVRLPETGPVLLTIDAVVRQENFTPERKAGPLDSGADGTQASTLKLLDVAKREHVALVIFGHDGPQWQMLKKLPDFYS